MPGQPVGHVEVQHSIGGVHWAGAQAAGQASHVRPAVAGVFRHQIQGLTCRSPEAPTDSAFIGADSALVTPCAQSAEGNDCSTEGFDQRLNGLIREFGDQPRWVSYHAHK